MVVPLVLNPLVRELNIAAVACGQEEEVQVDPLGNDRGTVASCADVQGGEFKS